VLIFEWDPEKARENEQKHEVTFAEAAEVFDDDHSSSAPDPDHSLLTPITRWGRVDT
jgi:uncharacterized DUF497 family protein